MVAGSPTLPSNDGAKSSPAFGLRFSVLALLLSAVVSAGGWLYYNYQYDEACKATRESLATIADLKAEGIANWMNERRGDAELVRVSQLERQLLLNPTNAEVRKAAPVIVNVFLNGYGYAAHLAVSPHGEVVFKLPPDYPLPDSPLADQIQIALHSKKVVVSDLHRTRPGEPTFLWIACPVLNRTQTNGPPDGAVLLVVDPRTFIFPTLKEWPAPNRTAETLLALNHNGEIEFVNELRYQTNAGSKPATLTDSTRPMLTSLAAQGTEGVFEAIDHRGVPVIAAVHKVSGTPWLLLAKMDEEEILAPLRKEEWEITVITALLVIAIALGISLVWRQQKLKYVRVSEERFRLLIENASDIITVVNEKGVLRFASPSAKRTLGYEPGELSNRSVFELIHEQDAPATIAALQRVVANPGMAVSVEYRFRHRDGSWRVLQSIGLSIPNQAPDGFVVVNARDITESRKLEEQFRQTQKMEGIGQLAGGVAHDFNNILAAMIMQAELTAMIKDLPEEALENLKHIRGYADRAAALTRQLLLFSRRQVIQPRDLDLNESITNLTKMLQRIIGEDVKFQLKLHSKPLITRADPGMVDQVLMNLAVNARDAMPSGGRLIVETSEKMVDEQFAQLHPETTLGCYVCLSVSDTGTGIPPEILPRIFEPFFTTKEAGKGTGLGLATVFGIVKQHAGWINVYSEPGQGTTFRIFFPASKTAPEALVRATAQAKPRGGTETVLLVEDEINVRTLTRAVLERAGYHVLETANGVEALKLWEKGNIAVQLLLTDMVMPEGLSGTQLAKRLLEKKPELKVVFISGYSAEIAGRELVLQAGQNFIQKPYSPNQLLETVRSCLDS